MIIIIIFFADYHDVDDFCVSFVELHSREVFFHLLILAVSYKWSLVRDDNVDKMKLEKFKNP